MGGPGSGVGSGGDRQSNILAELAVDGGGYGPKEGVGAGQAGRRWCVRRRAADPALRSFEI
jgi:hypothetical protein